MGRNKKPPKLEQAVNAADGYECTKCGSKFREMENRRCPHWVAYRKGLIMCRKCKLLFEVSKNWTRNSKKHLELGCDEVFVLTHPHTVTLTLFVL